MMETEFMGHEVVRQIMNLTSTWSPHGDWGWLMRKSQDIAVRTLRQLRRLYKGPEDEKFEEKAMNVVRLYIEESFHRSLLCYEKAELRAAMSSMMMTMHSLEEKMMNQAGVQVEMRLFSTMSEQNLNNIGEQVMSNTMRLEDCPSFAAVMSTEMRVEVFSLLPCEATEDKVAMTKDEQVALVNMHMDDGMLRQGRRLKMMRHETSLFMETFSS